MAARNRSKRVSELIRQIISELLLFKVKDPAAQKVVVHDVTITDNLRHVKVFVFPPGDEKQKKAAMEALDRAKGFIKKEIGQQAKLKYMPEIVFIYDESLDRADRIDYLLRSIK